MALPPTLSSKVELFLEARNLPSFDVTSSSDAFAVLEMQVQGKGWVPVARTEVIVNNNNPKWTTRFELEYRFEESQPMRVQIWDHDDLTAHDYIAETETTLGKLMGSRGCTLNQQLVRRQGRPLSATAASKMSLVMRASEIKSTTNDRVRFQFKGANLAAKDSGFFGIGASSDPYFIISRVMGDGSKMKIFQSAYLEKNLNPTWPALELGILQICNGDLRAPLQIEVWDFDTATAHDEIGHFTCCLQDLLDAPSTSRHFPLVKDKHKNKSGYKDSGSFVVASAQIIKVPSFLEYLQGGLQLSLVVAIDYTGSNGDPRSSTSLHYINPSPLAGPNEYLQATIATSSIMLDYDSDKNVPVFGFGGHVNGATSHCFPLTLNPSNPEVKGLEGIIGAYKNSFSHVALSGPTYFAPIIRQAAKIASSGDSLSQANQRYTVLLLLTDGAVCDEEETARAIIDASNLPLSIVLVGVGGADFGSLERLDGDSGLLRSGGRTCKRDIVQFVPFRKYAGYGAGAGSALAKEVLKEIPGQVVSAMLMRGIAPNTPITVTAPPAMIAATPAMMVPTVAGGAPGPATGMPPAMGMPPVGMGMGGPGAPLAMPPIAAAAAGAGGYPGGLMAPPPSAAPAMPAAGGYPGGLMGGLIAGSAPAAAAAAAPGPYPSLIAPGPAPVAGARPQGSI